MLSTITKAQADSPAMAAETNGRPIDSLSKGKANGHVVGGVIPKAKAPSRGLALKSLSWVNRCVYLPTSRYCHYLCACFVEY